MGAIMLDGYFPPPLIEVGGGGPKRHKQEPRALILQGKVYAEKINAGLDNEENTVSARYHICRHDEGKSCSREKI